MPAQAHADLDTSLPLKPASGTNLEVPQWSKILRTGPTLVGVVLVIGITLAVLILFEFAPRFEEAVAAQIVSLLDLGAQELEQDWSLAAYAYEVGQALSLVVGIVVAVVNGIIESVINSLAAGEKLNTRTAFETSLFTKLAIAFFVNTSVVTIIVSPEPTTWFEPNGPMQNIFLTAAVDATFTLAAKVFRVWRSVIRCVRAMRAKSEARLTTIYEPGVRASEKENKAGRRTSHVPHRPPAPRPRRSSP